MFKPLLKAFGVVAVTMSLAACQTTGIVGGSQTGVSVVDSKQRTHLDSRLTMADFLAFSENLTNKMLSSRQVQDWGSKRPKLIPGQMLNNTQDETIVVADIKNQIVETIFNSGMVRVVDKSATSFDYILNMQLSERRQKGANNQEIAGFLLQMKLSSIEGELVGTWSDTLTLAKAGKSLF
ncbi:hypothetical protein [Terasakiella sp.]|uniref:hypothetical protein n=1 Tax=Terasakiella sp. TaxID=2034861 RepID=UPI003AA90E4F